jgi:hypothetical protein
MSTEKKMEQETWLFLGMEVDDDYAKRGNSGLMYVFQPEIRTTLRRFSYKRKNELLPSFARPGSKWAVMVSYNEDRSRCSLGRANEEKPVYTGMIDDEIRLVALEANQSAAYTELRMLRQAKTDMEESSLDMILNPLRREYQRRNPRGRAALIGSIVESLGKHVHDPNFTPTPRYYD